MNFATVFLHSHICRLLPLISISTHFLLLLIDLRLSKYTWSIFYLILWMVVCNVLGRLGWHDILEPFFARSLLFHSSLLSVCNICLHCDGTFGMVFNATDCIVTLESTKIIAQLKLWILGLRFSSATSLVITFSSKAVPSASMMYNVQTLDNKLLLEHVSTFLFWNHQRIFISIVVLGSFHWLQL